MKEVVKTFLKQNRYILGLFIFASLFDAISTTIVNTKPGIEELNPLGEVLIQQSMPIHTAFYLSALPLIVLAGMFLFWAMSKDKYYSESLIEATGVTKTVAGINNTLIYFNHPSKIVVGISFLLFSAIVSHYITRLYIHRKNYKKRKKKLSVLPTEPMN